MISGPIYSTTKTVRQAICCPANGTLGKQMLSHKEASRYTQILDTDLTAIHKSCRAKWQVSAVGDETAIAALCDPELIEGKTGKG